MAQCSSLFIISMQYYVVTRYSLLFILVLFLTHI
jgi:hypothetical protein